MEMITADSPRASHEESLVSEDQIFDLLFHLCDLLFERSYIETSFLLEQTIDEFLIETGRVDRNICAPSFSKRSFFGFQQRVTSVSNFFR